ncbi:cation transporter [Formicincola oecophyllae]|uniref:Cation transporter n=1 Tax=Formicincola oecophyllae TaxID=2558361 RepID=A0A4Y6U9N0_9PROT|nr:cation diffusion facilitator family transporter [Formicincola oecophyllae]QDH13740.1 cation transporter [Formicincola oecophyllae]
MEAVHTQHGPEATPPNYYEDGHAGHDTGHDHAGHSHGEHHHGGAGHVHAMPDAGWLFAVGITLNGLYIAAEALWGLKTHSLALLADAGHNLSDVLGLVASWAAIILSRRAPSRTFTYGLKRATILSALGNATVLLLVTGAVLLASMERLFHPEGVAGTTVSLVALAGIAINGATALLFMKNSSGDLNIKSAFLHMASDAAMAAGVAVAGVAIAWTGWVVIDPIVSIIIGFLVIWGTWGLLSASLRLALDGVPLGIDPAAITKALQSMAGVEGVHHLHVWPMSTTQTALTAHLVTTPQASPALVHEASAMLQKRFGINHTTLQTEGALAAPPQPGGASCQPGQSCANGDCA